MGNDGPSRNRWAIPFLIAWQTVSLNNQMVMDLSPDVKLNLVLIWEYMSILNLVSKLIKLLLYYLLIDGSKYIIDGIKLYY
jgi:hypothetical protein